MVRRRTSLGIAFACAISITTGAFAEPLFGPALRDPDGRFENLGGVIRHGDPPFGFGFRRLWVAMAGRDGAPERILNDGAFLRENAKHSVPTVTWVGHATLLVQMGGTTFLTDPTWSDTASPIWLGPRRFVDPGIDMDALPPIDFVLISHNHYDHLDLDTLEALAERGHGTRFLVPLGNGALLRSRGIEGVEEFDWGDSRSLGDVEIFCLPTQHWSRRGLRDERRALWSSWAVLSPRRRFYFGGDSGMFPGFRDIGEKLGPFDLAAVPIGAYEPVAMMRPYHLDPEEAVQAGRDLDARHLLGMHFATFDLSDEPLDEPPRRFRAAAEAAGYGPDDAWILRIGETRDF